MNRKF